jgi:ABC-type branched-subunit amino acid transport system ATPase component
MQVDFLRLAEISVAFGGLRALDGLTLNIAKGSCVGIVGPNGAGKSTLIQTMTGFVRPSAGTIHLGTARLDGRAPEAIAALGVARTFQTSRVFPSLSVMDSVLVGAQRALIGGGRARKAFGPVTEPISVLLGLPAYRRRVEALRARAEAVMRLFDDRLWARRDQPSHSLSYANRRRLEIARALVAEPDVLLLDEPTAGMNPTETNELAEILASIRVRSPDMTILLVEHKLDVIRRLTDRVVVMDRGAVLVDGTPDDALGHESVVAAYLGAGRTEHGSRATAGAMSLAPRPPPKDAPPAVELLDVEVFYGAVQALFGVSLQVAEGEVVAVLGGNASGKSTTVKTVLGLVTPRAGAVRLFGTPITRGDTAGIIDLGVASIPEGRRMFAALTVRDNLLMGAYPRRVAGTAHLAAQLEQVVAEFPWLSGRLGQLAGTLSGGEQQMVALARAWLRRPRLLCIDEPSMGLSPRMVDQVYDVLFRWKAQGLTILMVEQNATMALELADRAYVLRNGAVSVSGAAAVLRADRAIKEAYLGAAP